MNGDFGRKGWIAALALVVLTAIAVGVTSYQAGVSRGLALQPLPAVAAPPAAGAPQGAPTPYIYPRYRMYRGWGGFGWFGGLFTLLIWLFIFRLIFRGIFGWGLCGWRRRAWGGYYGPGPEEFDDWHRRAHDRMREQGATPPPTA